jgi:hypothetical protein
MTEALVATLNVAFTKDDGLGEDAGKNRIVLQQVTNRLVNGILTARCFPSSGVQFKASVGSIEPREVRSWSAWESIKFSDSSEGQLKLPGATNVALNTDTMVLMRKVVNPYGDTTIQPALGAQVVWDATDEKVKVQTSLGEPIKVYGACFVQYTALYRMLYYQPNANETPVGGGNYSFVWTTGTIFGYNNYTVETLEMELDIKDAPEWVEFGRVTSNIVLDENGVWEYPENWLDTYQANKDKLPDRKTDFQNPGTFSYFTNSYTIDPDQSFTDERVHCIIKVNTTGAIQYEDFNNGGDGYTFWNMPYFALDYQPRYTCKFSNPPGGKKASSAEDFQYDVNNRTWRDVFLSVDKNSIKSRLRDEYPDIRDDNGHVL